MSDLGFTRSTRTSPGPNPCAYAGTLLLKTTPGTTQNTTTVIVKTSGTLTDVLNLPHALLSVQAFEVVSDWS